MLRDSQGSILLCSGTPFWVYCYVQGLPGEYIVMFRDSLEDASLYLYGSAQELPGDDIVVPAGLSSIVDALTLDMGINYVSRFFKKSLISIYWQRYKVIDYIFTLLVCMFVRLNPINVKTAEPIGPKFCVRPHMAPLKVYRWSKFQKFAANKIRLFRVKDDL